MWRRIVQNTTSAKSPYKIVKRMKGTRIPGIGVTAVLVRMTP